MKKAKKQEVTVQRILSAEEIKRRAERDAFHQRQQKRFEAGARLLRIRCKNLPSGAVLDAQFVDTYIEVACGRAVVRSYDLEQDAAREVLVYQKWFDTHRVPLSVSLRSDTYKRRPFYGVLHPSMYHWYAMQPASVTVTQWRLVFTKK